MMPNLRKYFFVALVTSLAVISMSASADSSRLEVKKEPEFQSTQTLTVAVVSSRSKPGDIEGNLNHFEDLIMETAGKGARFVLFPELALTAYSFSFDPKLPSPVAGCVQEARVAQG